jgi:peroxiredoxin
MGRQQFDGSPIRRNAGRASSVIAVVAVIAGTWFFAQQLRDRGDTTASGVAVLPALILETSAPREARVSAEEGAFAPDFEASLLDGTRVKLSDYRGHAVVLNFWATWCGSCLAEIPELERVHEERNRQGLVVIGVNVGESPARAESIFRGRLGAGYQSVADRNRALAREYHVIGVPVTVFIDRTGVIQKYIAGEISYEIFDRFARVALGETDVPGVDDPLPLRFVSPLPPEDAEDAAAEGEDE